jgi:alkanesulfonate monooxygenase SsuD/methylene tetrahydromethanopterin reductase-like flavin-dependent oxidoreductase (luciferase family)
VDAVGEYRRLFQQVHGREAPAPSVVDHVYCAADEAQCFQVVREHLGPGHFNTISGYEGEPDWPTEGADGQLTERRVVELVGTPEQLVHTLLERQDRLGDYEQVCQFTFGSLPHAEATANAQRFARDVLPKLRAAGVLESTSSTD